ncbi:hypothetical protein SRHO_G00181870 [Serrasalmus rhombeus]
MVTVQCLVHSFSLSISSLSLSSFIFSWRPEKVTVGSFMSIQDTDDSCPLQLQTADRTQHCSQASMTENERNKPLLSRKLDEKDSINAWHCMTVALHQISLNNSSDQPQSFLAQQRLLTQSRRGLRSRTKRK